MENLYKTNKINYLKIINNIIKRNYQQGGDYFGHEQFNIIRNNSKRVDMKKFWKGFSSGKNQTSDIQFPFDAIKANHYKKEDFIVGVLGKNLVSEKFDYSAIKFPENITKVYWYHTGKADFDNWHAILKLKYKKKHVYGYFNAECCYTGFDVCGDIRLYLSYDFNGLLQYGIEQRTIEKAIKDIKSQKGGDKKKKSNGSKTNNTKKKVVRRNKD